MQNSNCSQCSANITASGRTENSSVTVNKNNKLLNLYILSSISTRCNILQYSLFLSMLYMFQAVSPPIIRSSKLYTLHQVYRVSQEECAILWERVPYVKLYRYNPKHLYPKLNGYGDNGQRKVWTSCISAYCTSTAVVH